MSDPDIRIEFPVLTRKEPRPHEVLEREMFAGLGTIDQDPGNIGRSGYGIIEVIIGVLRPQEREPHERINGYGPEMLFVPAAGPDTQTGAPVQSKNAAAVEDVALIINMES